MIALDWKRGVVAIFLAGIGAALLTACGSPQAVPAAASSGQPRIVAVNVVPAATGSISVTKSYAAIVEARAQVDLVPLATGRLETLTVDIGSEVKKGEVIAELSHSTLDAQLQQAQAEFAAVKAAAKPNELQARAQLNAALAALNQLLNPSASDLEIAENRVTTAQSNLDRAKTKSAVAMAQSELSSAKTRLKQLQNPLASDLQRKLSAVAKAQSELNSAETKLNQLQNPSETDLVVAESAAAIAQSRLDSAKTKLSQLLNPPAPDLAAAEETVADARSNLSAAQTQLNQSISKQPSVQWRLVLGARIRLQANKATLENPALNSGLTPEEIADAEEAILANQERISVVLRELRSAPLLSPDDPYNSGSLIPADIRAALSTESEALKALETAEAKLREVKDPSKDTMDLVKNDVTVAQAALHSAQARLQELRNPSERTVALAQNNVAIAQASLDSAKEELKELQSPSQTRISLVRNNVAIAEAALVSAEAQARYEVDAAQAGLNVASARLNQLKTPRPAELADAKAQVAAAEQTLALNREAYARHNIQAAQARVNQIERQLAETQVLAPFDGVVTQIWLSLGAIASSRPKTPIVTVVSKDVVVSLRVEETAVAYFREGQSVQFASPALAGQRLELRIDRVAPAGDQKDHTFLVQMSPLGTVPDLKPGLSGEVSILAGRENVVLVPKEAVRRQGSEFSLFIVQDARAHFVEVAGGLTDGKNMEILGGVQPGDQVVVSGQNLLDEGTQVNVITN